MTELPAKPLTGAALPTPRPAPARRGAPMPAWVRQRPELVVGGAILIAMVLTALLAPYLAAADPRALSVADRLLPRSGQHPFGTDQFGRDLYARTLHGARISLAVGSASALLSCTLGTVFGLVSAATRASDAIMMRIMDGLMSIPPVLLAIALVGATGGSILTVIAAVVLVETPRVARLVRGLALSLREQTYVQAAVAAGTPGWRILWRHILPPVVSPVSVQFAFVFAAAMLIEAALSFIGAGIPPSTPSWGNMMADAKALWQVDPGLIFIPAVFLSVSVLGVNLIGRGVSRALDPKGRH